MEAPRAQHPTLSLSSISETLLYVQDVLAARGFPPPEPRRASSLLSLMELWPLLRPTPSSSFPHVIHRAAEMLPPADRPVFLLVPHGTPVPGKVLKPTAARRCCSVITKMTRGGPRGHPTGRERWESPDSRHVPGEHLPWTEVGRHEDTHTLSSVNLRVRGHGPDTVGSGILG